jgi:hypothetical protein
VCFAAFVTRDLDCNGGKCTQIDGKSNLYSNEPESIFIGGQRSQQVDWEVGQGQNCLNVDFFFYFDEHSDQRGRDFFQEQLFSGVSPDAQANQNETYIQGIKSDYEVNNYFRFAIQPYMYPVA